MEYSVERTKTVRR